MVRERGDEEGERTHVDDDRNSNDEGEENVDDKRDDCDSPEAGVEDAAAGRGLVKSDLGLIEIAKGQCLGCFVVGQWTERTTGRCTLWQTNGGDGRGRVLYLLGVVFVGNDHPG